MLTKLERFFTKIGKITGNISAIILILMIVNVFYDVIARYFFNTGSIAMQELEWHLFSAATLLGVAYTMQQDGHVRVDVIYDTLSLRKKIIINILGTVFLILPIVFIIGVDSIAYVVEAYRSNEQSPDPGGLPHRWIVKSLIPLSFFILIPSVLGFLLSQINKLRSETIQ